MLTDEETDFFTLNVRDMSPEDWDRLRRNAIAHARRTRSQVVKALTIRLFTTLSRALTGAALAGLTALARWYGGLLASRADRVAIARLQALDDCALKDIGIRRAEIESIVHARGNDETRARGDDRLAA